MPINADEQFPSKGDKLFRHDLPDVQNNACINTGESDLVRWYKFVDGYKDAADTLAEQIFEKQMVIDFSIYPLAYLHRHHVELVLKTVIIIGSAYADEEPPELGHHRLNELWGHARRYISMFWPAADTEPLEAAGELVSEFDKLDIGSFAFRYPVTKKGSNALAGVTHINVRHFAEMASRLGCFLTCCVTGMDVELDAKQEYLAAMLSEVASEYCRHP